MKIEAVLFDIDGTLVDSNEQHIKAWEAAFRKEGHPQDAAAICAQIGKGGDLLVPALLPQLAEDAQKRIAEGHGLYFKAHFLDKVLGFPRASDLIAKVRESGCKVVLASSAKREELDHYIAMLGIEGMVDASTSIDDVETSKPAPDIFSTALAKIGMAAELAIVVGDTPYDIEAASKAGIRAIGVESGPFSADKLKDAGAVAVFADVADLFGRFNQSPLAAHANGGR
jgi:phosphoglycolate phosphatase-like HAD superfamily hydrolase